MAKEEKVYELIKKQNESIEVTNTIINVTQEDESKDIKQEMKIPDDMKVESLNDDEFKKQMEEEMRKTKIALDPLENPRPIEDNDNEYCSFIKAPHAVIYTEMKSRSGNPLSTLEDCDMFAPEPSERDGWILKARYIQPEGSDANVWHRGYVLGRELQAVVTTGIEYDEAFKNPHFIKALPELVLGHQIRVEPNSYNLNGQLAIIVYIHGTKLQIKQGMPIAEIVFP